MCCFAASLMFFGPRLAYLVYWLIAPFRVMAAYAMFNFPWLVALMGLFFVPWTSLIFVLVFPLGGFDFIWLMLGLFFDLSSYLGSFVNRRRVPGYPAKDPLAGF